MKTDEIRASFLEFFRERDHVIERSDTIVPRNDPTLLFTSAGMVQFKPYYTGEIPLPYRRAATAQKCLRAGGKANDLDEVGKTSRHMTFFEMLGNFSFGDYFKREAITWAWEYVTNVLNMPPDRIWVSVFTEDDEAWTIWEKEIGIPTRQLVRMGAKDNFWGPAGETGACGPCSELHYDRGETFGPEATPDNDPNERFIEFWNLVFPQYDQQADGSRAALKNRGIDTGMGLERIAALIQDVETVFDTDGVLPIIEATQTLSNAKYGDKPMPFRVIADHVRALSFLIADGVLPANDGRGYVERRLLRRAARFGRELGLNKPFLHDLCGTVIDRMGGQYPELVEHRTRIENIILTEEQRFGSTLARGMDMLDEVFERIESDGTRRVPGSELFKLHDTFGFPLDLATDIATDLGYEVDREGFDAAMQAQRERARSAWTGSGDEAVAPVYRTIQRDNEPTNFVGYDTLESGATVIAAVRNGSAVDVLRTGESGEVVLDTTPFYAEAGGQVGDIGVLESSDAAARVTNTRSALKGLTVHEVDVTRGSLKPGDRVVARVDTKTRGATILHHTATHLLQAALRDALGTHVHQAGSLVAPDRLRFDFTHFEAIDPQRLQEIERLVNGYVRTDSPVTAEWKPLTEAKADGAMALFGEKYHDTVRVIYIGDISTELCGGTHVDRTGVIGAFKILSEASVASGVRRIEAVCGDRAVEEIQRRDAILRNAAHTLHTAPESLEERLESLQSEVVHLERELKKWKLRAATGGSVDFSSQIQEINGAKLLAAEVEGQDPEGLRLVMDKLREKLPSGIVVIGSEAGGKASLCVAVSRDLTGKYRAGDIVKELASIVGGGGGGRPDMAMAGGKHGEKVPEAIAKAPDIIRSLGG